MPNFWIKNDVDIKEWEKNTTGKLSIASEYFFNNSNLILNQDLQFKENFLGMLVGNIPISPMIRTSKGNKYKGINITPFNSELRKKLKCDSNILFEVYNDDGVFYTSGQSKGFDFAYLDDVYNLINLRNLCFGKRSLSDGEHHWKKTLTSNKFLKIASKTIDFDSYPIGEDIIIEKKKLTVLGEIQFGNWGLIYRDLFKLLHADANSSVDIFIYITATNNLLSYASDQIVSYETTIKELNKSRNLIKVPIWVIGLDIEI